MPAMDRIRNCLGVGHEGGGIRETPDQTPNATNHATPLHKIIYQGIMRARDELALGSSARRMASP